MKTHDLSLRAWGCNYEIMSLTNDGHNADISGWHEGIQSGDYILLKSGEGSTRYQVSSIEYMTDPRDMFFASIDFAPRQ
jgi:hypothetical protein